jgi:lipopolysaccharide export system protein LptA
MNHADKLIKALFITALLVTGNANALSTDKDQPVNIEADSVDVNEASETAIYRGNVVLIQGSINLNADKVVVHKFQSENPYIVATGNLVRFSQLPDNETVRVKGRSLKAEYELNSEKVELTGKAVLVKGPNTFKNDRIIYDRVNAIVKAGTSAKGKERVKITIGPQKK